MQELAEQGQEQELAEQGQEEEQEQAKLQRVEQELVLHHHRHQNKTLPRPTTWSPMGNLSQQT